MGLKVYITILLFSLISINVLANKLDFPTWLEEFKIKAEKNGISKKNY